jgi:uncharacterized Ntn-hydrolase superfamily protein
VTFSVTALDRATGSLGVAVASCYPAVGAVVPHVRAGIGAVATQALGDPALAVEILDRMADGTTPESALRATLGRDPSADSRQIAVVAADGSTAAHTGSQAVGHAGHLIGDGYVVAANLADSPDLLPAMAAVAGHVDERPFVTRLIDTLRAGEATGGDLRGRLAAAVTVEGAESLTLRVDAAAEPLRDIATALADMRAYALTGPTPESVVATAATVQPLFWHLLHQADRVRGADLDGVVAQMADVIADDPRLGRALGRFTTEGAAFLRARLGLLTLR